MDRLLTRKLCEKCKTVFPASFKGDMCEKCGGKLVKRDDDNEASISTRLSAYENETIPVIESYDRKKQMIQIEGSGTIDEVSELVFGVLDPLLKS